MPADILVPGTLTAGSQFVVIDGVLRNNLCGPNALARAEAWATQGRVALSDLYHRMRAAGRCDPLGASTLSGLAAQARADGFQVATLPYREPMPESTWRTFLTQYLGKAQVLVEVANDIVLKDLLTGAGEDTGKTGYHFFDIVGRRADGAWWASDGCNNVYNPVRNGIRTRIYNTSQLVLYSDAVLKAARPVGALAILPKFSFGGPPMWSKVNPGQWRDSAGHVCGGAMGQYMSDHNLLAADGLSSEVYKSVADLCDAYLPLGNGAILTAQKVAAGWQVRSDKGAQLMLALLAQQPAPPPAQGSPLGDQFIALVKQAAQS